MKGHFLIKSNFSCVIFFLFKTLDIWISFFAFAKNIKSQILWSLVSNNNGTSNAIREWFIFCCINKSLSWLIIGCINLSKKILSDKLLKIIKSPLVLVLVIGAVITILYYVMSPYQICIREEMGTVFCLNKTSW